MNCRFLLINYSRYYIKSIFILNIKKLSTNFFIYIILLLSNLNNRINASPIYFSNVNNFLLNDKLDYIILSNNKTIKPFINKSPILKSYGPLILDINNINHSSDVFFVPMLNHKNNPLFLAINCQTSLFNIKNETKWKGWFSPFFTYELNILKDFCNS